MKYQLRPADNKQICCCCSCVFTCVDVVEHESNETSLLAAPTSGLEKNSNLEAGPSSCSSKHWFEEGPSSCSSKHCQFVCPQGSQWQNTQSSQGEKAIICYLLIFTRRESAGYSHTADCCLVHGSSGYS